MAEIIASLNGLSLFFLITAVMAVKKKKNILHKKLMLCAVASSSIFLVFYLIHHYQVGSVPYPHHDWTRILYFFILIPHVILAIVMLPFIILALRYAFQNKLEQHKKVVRWVYPVWVYVSFTGVIVYFMLYQ